VKIHLAGGNIDCFVLFQSHAPAAGKQQNGEGRESRKTTEKEAMGEGEMGQL
jgi:hypothetical protein